MPIPSTCSHNSLAEEEVCRVGLHLMFTKRVPPTGQQVRRGPTSTNEFEVNLADMYINFDISCMD
jgi:hypothetical protein